MSLFKISPKTIVLGGLAIAAAAGALKNRDKVAGLIGARSSAPEPPRPEAGPPAPARSGDPASPAPANYDLAGPAANTATHVPAPEVHVRDEDGGIDERAEEEAAAAEAAAIGGGLPEYPGLSMDEPADEATRPLMEAGEGESEGEEIAEFDLVDEAELSTGETSDAERQINEIIEQADNPTLGESIEVVEANVDAASEDDKLSATTADDADDGPQSSAKDDDDPSNDGVRETESRANGSASESGVTSGFGFAGGKVGGEPDEDPAPGLPNAAAAEAVEEAAEEEGPVIHPDQTSLLDDEGPKETPAAEKSSAVWQPPKAPSGKGESEGEDDGGAEWQTWSGRAVKPE
jgi:hypothetical protein